MRRSEVEAIERGTVSAFAEPHHLRTPFPLGCRECGQTRLWEHHLLEDGSFCVTRLSCGRVDARSIHHGAHHSEARRFSTRTAPCADIVSSLAAAAIGAIVAPPGFVRADDSPQRQAASHAAALVSRYVQGALGADVSGETPDRKSQALPRGDRT